MADRGFIDRGQLFCHQSSPSSYIESNQLSYRNYRIHFTHINTPTSSHWPSLPKLGFREGFRSVEQDLVLRHFPFQPSGGAGMLRSVSRLL